MASMRFLPYIGLNGVRFGDSADAVLAALGKPTKQSKQPRSELLQFEYDDIVVRFDPDEGVHEISAMPSEIVMADAAIPIADLADFVRTNDPKAWEHVGFLFSEQFGLMVDLDHEVIWITALSRAHWTRDVKVQ